MQKKLWLLLQSNTVSGETDVSNKVSLFCWVYPERLTSSCCLAEGDWHFSELGKTLVMLSAESHLWNQHALTVGKWKGLLRSWCHWNKTPSTHWVISVVPLLEDQFVVFFFNSRFYLTAFMYWGIRVRSPCLRCAIKPIDTLSVFALQRTVLQNLCGLFWS